MSIDVLATDRITMSQKERDVLKILHGVLQGERSPSDAAQWTAAAVSPQSCGETVTKRWDEEASRNLHGARAPGMWREIAT